MAISNNLVQQASKPTFSAFLTQNAIKNKINEVIGGADGQRFMTQILSAVTNNPALKECDPMSILNCAFLGESLKLSPSPQLGYIYFVPFENKKEGTKKATFILGFKGYLQLAMRTGQYQDIDVIEIRQGEYLGRDKLTGKHRFEFIEDEDEREATEIIGYLGYFELVNGFRKSIYWSKQKMEKHADTYSPAFNLDTFQKMKNGQIKKEDMWKYSSFWYKNFDEMAFKTLIRQLISKWGIMSTDMQQAFEKDNTFQDAQGNNVYVENNDMSSDIIQPTYSDPVITDSRVDNIPAQQTTTSVVDDIFG